MSLWHITNVERKTITKAVKRVKYNTTVLNESVFRKGLNENTEFLNPYAFTLEIMHVSGLDWIF